MPVLFGNMSVQLISPDYKNIKDILHYILSHFFYFFGYHFVLPERTLEELVEQFLEGFEQQLVSTLYKSCCAPLSQCTVYFILCPIFYICT
ncbi:hypothetical protein FKM82_006797 [Ascaphus truei]